MANIEYIRSEIHIIVNLTLIILSKIIELASPLIVRLVITSTIYLSHSPI